MIAKVEVNYSFQLDNFNVLGDPVTETVNLGKGEYIVIIGSKENEDEVFLTSKGNMEQIINLGQTKDVLNKLIEIGVLTIISI